MGYDDDRHVCLISGNRGGKGATSIINNLCLWPGSLVVIDPAGENATIAAARRGSGSLHCEGMGQSLYVLDPFQEANVPDEFRGRFNPLDVLDPKDEEAIDEASRIADAMVVSENAKDPVWDDMARMLIHGLILHLITAPEYENQRTLITLRKLLTQGDWAAVEALEANKEENIPSGQALLWQGVRSNPMFDGVIAGIGETFRSMLISAPKQFEGVIQSARLHTAFIDSPGMKRCLAASDFKLSDLKTSANGVSIFLSLPQRFMNTHYRWLRMMITLLVTEMEKVKRQPACGHRVLMCLDEFAGLKKMAIMETAVADIAKRGVKLFFVLQSLDQLKGTYDKWETFLANCGVKLFCNVDDHFSRDYVSKFIGDTEIIVRNNNNGLAVGKSQGKTTGTSTSTSVSESETTTEGTTENESFSLGENTGRSHAESIGKNWGRNSSEGSSDGISRGRSWNIHPLFFRNTSEVLSLFRQNEQVNRGIQSSVNSSTGYNWGDSRSATDTLSEGKSATISKGLSTSRSTARGKTVSETQGSTESKTETETSTENKGVTESRQKRPLITPQEIGEYFARTTDPQDRHYPGYLLTLIAGERPAVIRRSLYYEEPLCVGCYNPHPDHPETAPPVLTEDISSHELKFPGPEILKVLSEGGSFRAPETDPVLEEKQPKVRRWLKKPGDFVMKGEPLLELDSIREIPGVDTVSLVAPISGQLTEIHIDEGHRITPDLRYGSIRHSVRRHTLEGYRPHEDFLLGHVNRLQQLDEEYQKLLSAQETARLAQEAEMRQNLEEALSSVRTNLFTPRKWDVTYALYQAAGLMLLLAAGVGAFLLFGRYQPQWHFLVRVIALPFVAVLIFFAAASLVQIVFLPWSFIRYARKVRDRHLNHLVWLMKEPRLVVFDKISYAFIAAAAGYTGFCWYQRSATSGRIFLVWLGCFAAVAIWAAILNFRWRRACRPLWEKSPSIRPKPLFSKVLKDGFVSLLRHGFKRLTNPGLD